MIYPEKGGMTMKPQQQRKTINHLRSLCITILLCIGLTLTALAEETAATVQITKTEGTVNVTNATGRSVSRLTKLRLHSGYHLNTDEKSYAWVALDGERLAKVDAVSELETRKKGKVLELLVHAGSVYFDISEPLTEDESLNICTSTMVIGVRGTSGWVDVIDQYHSEVHVLEGVVTCTTVDPVTGVIRSVQVHGGESASVSISPGGSGSGGGAAGTAVQSFTEGEVNGFILTELAEKPEHCQKIYEKSGLDFRSLTAAEAVTRQSQDEAQDAEICRAMRLQLSRQPHTVHMDSSAGSSGGGGGGGGVWNPESRGFACDGFFAEWTNVPHFTIDYGGPESDVESKSAIHVEDGILYGHVVITRPGAGESLSGRFLDGIQVSFNGDNEYGIENDSWLYPAMLDMDGKIADISTPAPPGESTYSIYDRRYPDYRGPIGKAMTFISVDRDEMEFEISLVEAADRIGVDDGSLWMFAVRFSMLGAEWASVAGIPTGTITGLALSFSAVGLGYVFKRKKIKRRRNRL